MHDIRLIRDEPAAFDAAMKQRGLEPQAERLIDLDARRRAATARLQELETERNAKSKEIGKAKAQGDEARFTELRSTVETLKAEMERLTEEARTAEEVLNQHLAALPNRPLPDVPEGADESGNKEVRGWGEARNFTFAPKDHVAVGERVGLDFERAAAMSGARFAVLQGPLARLERALGQFMLDVQTEEHGYRETAVPYLVRDEALFGTGQLPKFEEDLFKVPFTDRESALRDFRNAVDSVKDEARERAFDEAESLKTQIEDVDTVDKAIEGLFEARVREVVEKAAAEVEARNRTGFYTRPIYLIPTAEVPLTNLVRDAIHAEGDFPLRLTALTPCFRSEAGSAGRDTRGLIRMHQFHKVELVSITTPEQSDAELERMTGCAEEILRRLELPYRVMMLCTGDMGFAARKTYDLEVWMPSQETYREISSCSSCGDFQARRMNARYRREGEKKPEYLHTLNGSGLAVGRALVAILENHQNEDGSVTIPQALRSYMGGLEKIG